MNDPRPAPPILELRNVCKSYRIGSQTLHVLRNVDLQVQRGEFLALRGTSGAGKSTLLHLCGGLDLADSGSVSVSQQPLNDLPGGRLAEFRNLHIGFIFQAYHLLPELTALENVCLPARIGRRNFRDTIAQARKLLDRVGLKARLDHRPNQLSGGEQQRVGIARALINSPELILADEPTGNLDSHTGLDVLNLLLELRAEHQVTLLIATHDPRVANRAQRTLHLVDGRIDAIECPPPS